MSDFEMTLKTVFRDTDLLFPFAITLGCILAGIVFSQLVSASFRKVAARMSGGYGPLIKHAFTGLSSLWGIPVGGYAASYLLTFYSVPITPAIQYILEMFFRFLLFFFLTITGARFISAFVIYKVQKIAGNFASTTISGNAIELITYVFGFTLMLHSFGITITPLLTALGVGGLAVALALQDTLSNLFSGINLLLAGKTKVGDFIKLSTGEEGVIADMNWRNTTLRQFIVDNLVVIPNHKIANSTFVNFALPSTDCSIVVPIGVSYDSNLAQVEKITLEVAKKVLLETDGAVSNFEPFLRYNEFGAYSINFNVYLRIANVIDQALIRHEFIKQIHVRYAQEGIDIPCPIQTVKLQGGCELPSEKGTIPQIQS